MAGESFDGWSWRWLRCGALATTRPLSEVRGRACSEVESSSAGAGLRERIGAAP